MDVKPTSDGGAEYMDVRPSPHAGAESSGAAYLDVTPDAATGGYHSEPMYLDTKPVSGVEVTLPMSMGGGDGNVDDGYLNVGGEDMYGGPADPLYDTAAAMSSAVNAAAYDAAATPAVYDTASNARTYDVAGSSIGTDVDI